MVAGNSLPLPVYVPSFSLSLSRSLMSTCTFLAFFSHFFLFFCCCCFFSLEVSDHELAFRVNVTVPDSGNYTLAIRPTEAEVAAAAAAASSSSRGTSSSNARESGSSDGLDDYTVTVKWNVDLTRPETKVLYGPDPVTTEGSAEFLFACELDGERLEYPQECLYEYQISTVGMESALEMQAEVDWESKDWFSTVRREREKLSPSAQSEGETRQPGAKGGGGERTRTSQPEKRRY